MDKYDFLKPYIPNRLLKFIVYFLIVPILLGSVIAFGHFILAALVIYLAYKNIKDEKLKWGVIGGLTLAILILGTFTKNEIQTSKVPNTETKQTQENSTDKNNQVVNNTEPTANENTQNQNEETYLVTRVIDGDTIEIEGEQRVRYIGIDTPETVDPNRPVGCYGKEASDKNSELVLNKKVKLVKDVSDTDKYGRLLRYVYIEDIFVNDYLVLEGYAKASTYAPDVKYSEQFINSERKAREEKKGLWSETCEITPQTSNITSTYVAPPVAPAPAIGGEAPITPKPTITNLVSSGGVVKKSSTGICHAPGTTYYDKTKNFKPYDTIQDCLDSGGRLPLR